MATARFTMAINGCGWLLVVVLFTHNMSRLHDKVGGGAMYVLVRLSKRVKRLKEFALGFALVIGLAAGYIFM